MSETSTDLGSMASVLRELAAAPIELLVRGTILDDQYEVERVIGHGAMGVVYLARDRRLERNVAVKLARGQSPVMLAQTSREAMLLARLSHPNVVVIHQVGSVDERVYVAMEYVDGATARDWCQSRSADEVVALYTAVGDGLAAAHASGLVHRDFKPDNVLVGEDGRGRVADFGLAREMTDSADGRAGTPAYMAPEQLRGEDVDARADQYAFCASLREALAGKRLRRHIDVALGRGMAPDRDVRWPSMAPLLAELRRKPINTMKATVLSVALLAVIVLWGVSSRTDHAASLESRCRAGAHHIGELWPTRYPKLRTLIDPAGSPQWVEAASIAAVSMIDKWTERWIASDRAVCTAAWTPALHDRAVECLSRDEHALVATLDSLEEPGFDPTKLADAVGQLPRPESCTDPLYLHELVPPPTDPILAAKVAEAQAKLDRIPALEHAGHIATAVHELEAAEAAPKLDYAPLAVRLHLLRATVDRAGDDNEKALEEIRDVYFEARAAGVRETAISAANETVLLLIDMSRDADAEHWARLAEAEIANYADPQLQAITLSSLALVATARSNPTHALELLDRSMALLRTQKESHEAMMSALQARAEASAALGKYDQALADLDEASAILKRVYGPVHPRLSTFEEARALVLDQMGKKTESVAAARHGLAIAESTAPGSTYVTNAIGQLGTSLSQAHQFPEAVAMLDRSIAANRKESGERSYNVASDLNNRCDLLTQMGRYDDAIASGKQAIEIWTEVLGKDGSEIAIAEFNVALALLDARRYDEVLAESERGIAIAGKQPEGPTLGVLLIVHAEAAWRRGHVADAHKDLDRSIAIFTASSPNPAWLPWAQLERAYVDKLEGHLDAARPLATSARDTFRAIGDPHLRDADELVAELRGPK